MPTNVLLLAVSATEIVVGCVTPPVNTASDQTAWSTALGPAESTSRRNTVPPVVSMETGIGGVSFVMLPLLNSSTPST